MSDTVFADTFYYLALGNPRNAAHASAIQISLGAYDKVLTSAWVIQELADGLAAPHLRKGFLADAFGNHGGQTNNDYPTR
jgi:hypothetical protein